MIDTIISAIPQDNFLIEIVTSSGISGTFDVKPYFGGSAFEELQDESYFHLVRPAHHGIIWPNEQDFCSDTIVWDIQNSNKDA